MRNRWRALARSRALQLVTLTAMFGLLAVASCLLKLSVLGADIGWHLRVGDWIVQHRAFPHTGILSRTAAERPWAAYSWGYEVLLSRANAWFGLVGVGLYGTALTVLAGFSIFWMTRRLAGRFWTACLLTVLCCYGSLLLRMVPRPLFFSIALYCVVLMLVMEANRSGQVGKLYWLPLVFLFWTNLHIQFVYGLGVVGLLLAVNIGVRLAGRVGITPRFVAGSSLPSGRVALVFLACVAATMVGPYSYRLYGVIFQYSQAKAPYAMIMELQPPSFHMHSDWVRLLLAGVAFVAVILQKKIDVFKLALLLITSFIAFRTMRDAWFQCIAATACIADLLFAADAYEAAETPFELGGVLAAVSLLVLLCAPLVDFNEAGLRRAMSSLFPVDAVEFLAQHRPAGPLWNPFDWGGFLTWYLPQYPVAVDGRTDLYGEELEQRFHDTELGDANYRNDPYLAESGILLLRARDGLVPLLEDDTSFQKVYQDKVACVFVRR